RVLHRGALDDDERRPHARIGVHRGEEDRHDYEGDEDVPQEAPPRVLRLRLVVLRRTVAGHGPPAKEGGPHKPTGPPTDRTSTRRVAPGTRRCGPGAAAMERRSLRGVPTRAATPRTGSPCGRARGR